MCEHVAFLPVVRLDSASSNRICPPTSGDIASTAGTFSISTPHPRGSAFGSPMRGRGVPPHGNGFGDGGEWLSGGWKGDLLRPSRSPYLSRSRLEERRDLFQVPPPHPRGVGFWVTNEGEGGAPPMGTDLGMGVNGSGGWKGDLLRPSRSPYL